MPNKLTYWSGGEKENDYTLKVDMLNMPEGKIEAKCALDPNKGSGVVNTTMLIVIGAVVVVNCIIGIWLYKENEKAKQAAAEEAVVEAEVVEPAVEEKVEKKTKKAK